MSESLTIFVSNLRIVNACKPCTSASVAFSSILHVALLTTSNTSFDDASIVSSSTFLYNQFISFNLSNAALIRLTSTRVCQTVLLLVD